MGKYKARLLYAFYLLELLDGNAQTNKEGRKEGKSDTKIKQ
jgi:hypothetical protein